jgi:hypothetical protein
MADVDEVNAACVRVLENQEQNRDGTVDNSGSSQLQLTRERSVTCSCFGSAGR